MTGDATRLVLLANVASTLILVGLIWFVQVVHYPQFASVGADHFIQYQAGHVRLTSWVVVLPMFIEAVTSALLAWKPPSADVANACWASLLIVIAIWLSTAFLQVPGHNALGSGFNAEVHRSLVLRNWFRTIAWSARGAIVLFLLNTMIAGG